MQFAGIAKCCEERLQRSIYAGAVCSKEGPDTAFGNWEEPTLLANIYGRGTRRFLSLRTTDAGEVWSPTR